MTNIKTLGQQHSVKSDKEMVEEVLGLVVVMEEIMAWGMENQDMDLEILEATISNKNYLSYRNYTASLLII